MFWWSSPHSVRRMGWSCWRCWWLRGCGASPAIAGTLNFCWRDSNREPNILQKRRHMLRKFGDIIWYLYDICLYCKWCLDIIQYIQDHLYTRKIEIQCRWYMHVSENSGTPKIIHFNRAFHYKLWTIHFGVPLFLETPNIIFVFSFCLKGRYVSQTPNCIFLDQLSCTKVWCVGS